MTRYFMGIDPGASGGVAVVDASGKAIDIWAMPPTPVDIALAIGDWHRAAHLDNGVLVAALEQVHAMPKQGVASTFKFGAQYGSLQGILAALQVPYHNVTPQAWQKTMQCLTKGDKNVSKRRAQELFPALGRKITHATADALLIAEWLRLKESGR